MINLIEKAERTHSLSKEELILLLNSEEINRDLFKAADRVRKVFVGDEVHLRGLIEFSNICKRNCLYCGLRAKNNKIKRFRLEPEKIIDLAVKAKGYGYKTIVLQSGEDDYYDVEKICYIVSEIKKQELAITLSIGEKTFEEYESYKAAGADRYLLRIETTDKDLYTEMDPLMSYENRKSCLNNLKSLGFEVGSGCLVGLPGQSMESIADDIMFFKEINADMIGIGPFIPNPDTPLKHAVKGNFDLSLKVMALTRLLLPDINIPATTAMESLKENGRILALLSGANVIMPNVSEGEPRKLYALYPGKISVEETPEHSLKCVSEKIESIGRSISTDYGYHMKNTRI